MPVWLIMVAVFVGSSQWVLYDIALEVFWSFVRGNVVRCGDAGDEASRGVWWMEAATRSRVKLKVDPAESWPKLNPGVLDHLALILSITLPPINLDDDRLYLRLLI